MPYRANKQHNIDMSGESYMIYIELKWIKVEDSVGYWVTGDLRP